MRILLVTQNFYPESFKGNDIAFELAKRGYQVDVLTAIPNYPQGRFYKGYGLFSKRKEIINGVTIRRVLTIPRRHNKICLIFNYLSFWIFGSIRAFFLALTQCYDRVFVHQISPIMQAYPGIVVSRMQHIPLYMWVLDIWPDSMISGGNIRNKTVIRIMNRIVTHIYDNCTKILISSQGFRDLVNRNGDYNDRIVYFPNWCDDLLLMPIVDIPEVPKGFRIMMAGNLGEAHRLNEVMKVALMMRNETYVKWIFVGDGSKKRWLEDFVKKNKLETTVFILGRYPFTAMPAFFAQADAMLLTLKADFPHLRAVVPARLQSYMSAARPILAMVDGGAAHIIEAADCGYAVSAEDTEALVSLIRDKVLTDPKTFAEKGQNGRCYFERHFTKEHCMNNLEKIIA